MVVCEISGDVLRLGSYCGAGSDVPCLAAGGSWQQMADGWTLRLQGGMMLSEQQYRFIQ